MPPRNFGGKYEPPSLKPGRINARIDKFDESEIFYFSFSFRQAFILSMKQEWIAILAKWSFDFCHSQTERKEEAYLDKWFAKEKGREG